MSVNALYSITVVEWLRATKVNFSSTTALSLADIEGLPSNNTMGPVNERTLQYVRKNHAEKRKEDRHGRFIKKRAQNGEHNKMIKQVRTPPAHFRKKGRTPSL